MGADTREDIINFTEADRYVQPKEPEVLKKAGMVQGPETGVHGALGHLQPARHVGELAYLRWGRVLVQTRLSVGKG